MLAGIAACLTASGVAFTALAATTTDPIADVIDLVNEAFQTPPDGEEGPISLGDRLLSDSVVRTAADSAVEMSFPDGAVLRLEAESEMTLDSYVYDPDGAATTAQVNLNSGLMRFTTDEEAGINDEGIVFETPVATVGIRGTDIAISVGADGSTVVDVLSGSVVAKPKEHEQSVGGEEGDSILITNSKMPPQVGAIGDFATAAGPAPGTGPGFGNSNLDSEGRSQGESGQARGSQGDGSGGGAGGNSGAGGGGSDGGSGGSGGGGSGGGGSGGGGSGGGGSGGGGSGGADGDGNSGHGDNDNGRDPDNPGKGKDNSGQGNGNGNGKGLGRD
ncbi:FecR family protein [Dongia mobilis]|uniref:FecR family protein n=1 Tax=Dongia mobilis TaxID=578943 RepID=UPI00141507C6|nr:FecR family protein [Dongia mobilis]